MHTKALKNAFTMHDDAAKQQQHKDALIARK